MIKIMRWGFFLIFTWAGSVFKFCGRFDGWEGGNCIPFWLEDNDLNVSVDSV
jgi:hypothetical protein